MFGRPFCKAQVSLERIFEVLDTPDDGPDDIPAEGDDGPVGDVVFSNVGFRYASAGVTRIASLEAVPVGGGQQADLWALRNVTFVASASSITALVGPSGSGKSTLCGLLAGLYRPDSGTITIGGTDISKLSGAQIRRSVGMVTQDPFFFHDTIAANLRLAKPAATDDQLVEVCTRAHIHNLISSLPDSYQTLVGQRGHRLSGGEKQRLAVARLLLKDPDIVILDEATAHLDSHAERLVKEALDVALRGRTALIIAHRLSTVLTADQIRVLTDGQIIERGRHAELINDGGAYASLYNAQFSGS
jgi:ATP-binding cassette subfamily B protein